MLDLSSWLQERGHRVIPFAMQHAENLPSAHEQYFPSEVITERAAVNGGSLRTFGRMLYSLEARRKFSSLLVAEKPQLVHVHNIYTQLSPSILHTAKVLKVPVIMTVHDHHLVSPQYNLWASGCGENYQHVGIVRGTFSRFHKGSRAASFAQIVAYKFHRAFKLYEKGVDLFSCPSQYMAKQLVAAGYPKEKIRVNPYGIDSSHIKPNYGHKGYVLFAGRLSAEKGVETVIEAARQLPDIAFRIVGTGPEEAKLHQLGHACRNITFVGFRDGEALREEYAGAMAVMVPSRVQEVFPLVILEAMAAGKPVVASNVGGVPEVVEDRGTGLLVAPLDMQGWVEALRRLSLDEAFRLHLARRARLASETTFHVRHHHERLLKAYQELAPGAW